VERHFLQLSVWDQFNAAEAEFVARALAPLLPPPWKFQRVEKHECGDQQRQVAFFTWKRARFALIPGSEVTLGYDRRKPFIPNEEQRESWRLTREEYGLKLGDFLKECLTPLRTVVFEPFLLEVMARQVPPTEMADGFRLPTFDEWEYACSAGSRTLFRWGNDCPADCYPIESRWKEHRQPNAFGLMIASNPYDVEYCVKQERKKECIVVRGGDGGSAICGGTGFFSGWIPLASAYYAPDLDNLMDSIDGYCRRAFSLPEDCLD
jgi:hypothetical protein